ncbi:MAG: hypothetical protein KTR18_05275 [Acidiferrobacterales bacterium]|nr:hypothetical protein [Acidiferrobacterales bacterium]
MFKTLQYLCLAVLSLAIVQIVSFAQEIPDGYRGKPYKAPTPWSAPGATTLSFPENVQDLIAQTDVVLINVSPITLSPEGADGVRTWIPQRGKEMYNIPGSIWLPNVGYQTLDTPMMDYFQRNMSRWTGGDLDRPVLFYCTADCWMSWNAVKRAGEELGYTDVYWYPHGIDGWKEVNLALELATPIPFVDVDSQ